MSKKRTVIIVESPAKAKTIGEILGKDYEVLASKGHIRDLPKKSFGISEDLEPSFEVIPGKEKVVEKLKKEIGGKRVLLASDMDREGEAIAWHVSEVLKLPKKKIRITFSAITPKTIKEAIEKVRDIDMNLVTSQFARRMLDRIVGYRISPLLWRIFRKNNLSAGRVQSATLKIVCDREREIFFFKPRYFWRARAFINEVKFDLIKIGGKKIGKNLKEEDLKPLKGVRTLRVLRVEEREVKVSPPEPFTTSTLQQTAFSKLKFSVKKTMTIAQQLYEGLDTPQGHMAFITYHRTDSTRIADEALEMGRSFIESTFGGEYVGGIRKKKKKKGKIQDAHEAIRPVDVEMTPEKARKLLPEDHAKLYELVWKRFVASMMSPAIYRERKITLVYGDYEFEGKVRKRVFDGFERVWDRGVDESWLDFREGDEVKIDEMRIFQDSTKPPERFTEGSLVKEMERVGIGRPSTYAPTVSTLLARRYLVKYKGKLYPTLLGFLVMDFLEKNFPDIVNVSFTAKMEEKLDKVESGEKPHKEVLIEFLKKFDEDYERAKGNFYRIDYETDQKCECGGKMRLVSGRYGVYMRCEKCGKTKSVRLDRRAVISSGMVYFEVVKREGEIDERDRSVEQER